MGTVSVRELKHDTANILRRVESGEEVEITSHGRPTARLSATSEKPQVISRDAARRITKNWPQIDADQWKTDLESADAEDDELDPWERATQDRV